MLGFILMLLLGVERHGVYVTARALGLQYNKLKRCSDMGSAAVRRSQAATLKKPVRFIELAGALPMSTSGCRLSLQGPSGQRLQLDMAPSAATAATIHQ
jgi:hypothetical protein